MYNVKLKNGISSTIWLAVLHSIIAVMIKRRRFNLNCTPPWLNYAMIICLLTGQQGEQNMLQGKVQRPLPCTVVPAMRIQMSLGCCKPIREDIYDATQPMSCLKNIYNIFLRYYWISMMSFWPSRLSTKQIKLFRFCRLQLYCIILITYRS